MGIFSIFKKKSSGTIYLKPSETSSAGAIVSKTGAAVSVPAYPGSPTFTGGGITSDPSGATAQTIVSSGGGGGSVSFVGTSGGPVSMLDEAPKQTTVSFTPKDESAMRISTEKGREKWFSFGTDPGKARYEYGFPILKPEEEKRFKEKGLAYTGTSFIEGERLTKQTQIEAPMGTYEEFIEPTFWQDPTYGLRKKAELLQTEFTRGKAAPLKRAEYFGLGAATVGVGIIGFVKSLTTDPYKTIISIPSGLIYEAKGIGAGAQSLYPEYAFGKIAGYAALYAAPKFFGKGVGKVSDIYRTRGMTKLKPRDIIAPEIYKGQTFPTIKKGSTAGQLLSEFKPIEVLGEVKPAGFTASPKPFKSITEAGVGSSELPGVYQSPYLNPYFLKILEGEKTLFRFKPFESLKPTAIRITPKSFELVPGLKFSQKNLAPLKETIKFFGEGRIPKKRLFGDYYYAPKIKLKEGRAELGKSYIPFIKLEKEAILTPKTPLALTQKKFFFKFEGRRIPIYQYDIFEISKARPTIKTETLADISRRYSSSKVGKGSYLSPADIIKLSSSYLKSYQEPSSYITSIKSSYVIPTKPSYGSGLGKSYYGSPSYGSGLGKSYYGSYGGDSYKMVYSPTYYGGTSYYQGEVMGVPGIPPTKKPPVPPRIRMEMFESKEILRATRKFVETPTLFGALAMEFGFKAPKGRGKAQQRLGIPLESPFKQVKFESPTLLGGVKKIKLKQKEYYI